MQSLVCNKCQAPPLILGMEMVDDNTFVLKLLCFLCEQEGEVKVEMRNSNEEGYGGYL